MPLFGPPNIEKLKDKRDVNGLINALNHPLINHTCYLNLEAAKALGELGDALAVEPLLVILQRSDFDVMREAAAIALGLIGDAQAVKPLIRATKDTYPKVRKAAAQALGKIGDPQAAEALLKALSDAFPEVREQAMQAIRALGDVHAIKPLAALYGDPIKYDRDLREAADRVVQEIASSGKPGAVETLISVVQEYDGGARSLAGRVLVKLGGVAIEPLCSLLSSPNRAVRVAAVQALGKIGGVQAVKPLSIALLDGEYEVYSAALEAMAQIGETAIEPLVVLLNQPGEKERMGVCAGLIRLGWTPDKLPDGSKIQTEMSAAKKDLQLRMRAEIGRLLPLLEAEQWNTRREAAIALRKLYSSGEMLKVDRASILKVRNKMVEQHQDGKGHHDQTEYHSGPYWGDKTELDVHEDSVSHRDVGIGVEFPL